MWELVDNSWFFCDCCNRRFINDTELHYGQRNLSTGEVKCEQCIAYPNGKCGHCHNEGWKVYHKRK